MARTTSIPRCREPSPGSSTAKWIGPVADVTAMEHKMSPAAYVRRGQPPVFIAHGDADPTVPYLASQTLKQDLDKAGVPNVMITVPGGHHGQWTPEESIRVQLASLKFLEDPRSDPMTYLRTRTICLCFVVLAFCTTAWAAGPLRSPWDLKPVTVKDAGSSCPPIVSLPKDIEASSFYDDPQHSKIDPKLKAKYDAAQEVFRGVTADAIGAAEKFRSTGNRGAAECVLRILDAQAEAQAMTGSMSSNQGLLRAELDSGRTGGDLAQGSSGRSRDA